MKSHRSTPLSAQTPSMRASAFTPLVRHFRQQSKDLQPILQARGLSQHAIQDPYGIVPLSAFFWVLEDSAVHLGDPILGARLGQSMSAADLGPTGILLSQSSTLRRGLRRFHDSLSALQGATEMEFGEDGDMPQMTYQLKSDKIAYSPQDSEFSFSGLCQLIRAAFDARWRPEEVHFQHAQSKRYDLLERIFRAPVRFDQPTNRILMPPETMDIHHRDEDKALIGLIERHISDLAVENDLNLAERVKMIVSRRLGHTRVDLKTVAQELGQTPRSLQRHLAREGTSLRDITREHRKQSARTQLDDPNIKVNAVAQSLGYSDATAFGRAYRAWFDDTPTGRN